jgi:hypothetical protein
VGELLVGRSRCFSQKLRTVADAVSGGRYLAATAMGLAARAIRGGDADLFAWAAGTDYRAETSVGVILLGSRRPGPVGPGC